MPTGQNRLRTASSFSRNRLEHRTATFGVDHLRLVQWLTVPSESLHAGDRVGPFELPVDPDSIRQFAEATLDDSHEIRHGRTVPPALVATRVYRAQLAAITELVPLDIFSAARSGVHGQHELLLHRPISADEKLHTFSETHSARPSEANLRVTLHHSTFDDREDLVAEQWWTTVLLGTTAEPTGPAPPDYSFSSSEGVTPVAEDVVRIDEVMARRYAQVSGDYNDHHFSAEAARRSGYEAPFLHGLCTMALCARAATGTVANGDPRRIRRIAVRFVAPAFLGHDLRVQIYQRADGNFALEAGCGGTVVIKNGLVQLVPRSGD